MKSLNVCSLDELQTALKSSEALDWREWIPAGPQNPAREAILDELNSRVDEAPEIPEHWHSRRTYFR